MFFREKKRDFKSKLHTLISKSNPDKRRIKCAYKE